MKLYELGHDHTWPFFTMEYLQGEELEDYLRRDPSQSAVHDSRGFDAAWLALGSPQK